MKTLLLLLGCLVAAMLSACSSLRGLPSAPSDDTKTPAWLSVSDTQRKAYADATDPEKKKALRNAAAGAALGRIDQAFHKFISDVNREKRATSLVSRVAVIGLSAAATIVTPPGTKEILAGTATAVAGSEAALKSEVYDDLTTTAIIAQMVASRKRVGDELRANLTKSAEDYPLELAELDWRNYYLAGTVLAAQVELVGSATASSNTTVGETYKGSFAGDAPAKTIRGWLFQQDPEKPNEVVVNKERKAQLIKWLTDDDRLKKAIMKAAGTAPDEIGDLEMTAFLYHEQYADIRKEFVEKSGLIAK